MKNRGRLLKIIIPIVTVICSALFIPWGILAVWISPLPDSVQKEVESAINNGLDGIIVYVDQGDETSLYSAGWHNRDDKVVADPEALFKIASISKLYIAVAAAKLVDDQMISLDDNLAVLLPEYAGSIEYSDRITLRMMLQHRSGIPNYLDQPDYPWVNPPKNNEKTLQLILGMPADFTPGEKYSYSNTNYLLIGMIMDKTLGYSHHRYIKDEILTPLNLNNTYSLLKDVDLNDVMSGYSVGYDSDIKYNDFVNPGGSMLATAEDVGIFLRALIDGSLLTNDEQAIYSEIYKYEHTGLLPGYQSIAKYHKDIDTVVVQFVNTSGGDSWSKSEIIYNRIIRILQR
ncbi:class A beta-lactamase-related serine hydrolase [Bacillus sp. HMF5848]|uniref:serine hydrolase domain-containing protein n=1 Tax=Bacillus sp. HMF5848 TaxID=2495421 RepID=UPI000F7BA910|nr:serine hydrolase domain-containing protein [Bacillus sp. HMF5848]RSK29154.1 class A beta-lactamase-related serine hydrolase [Bacillus sp. HMF5848]